jgi:dolichyl-phosphate-mannose-protein mannosyltransferase
MASESVAVTSGANAAEADALRRRNIPTTQPGAIQARQPEDKKKAPPSPSVLKILDEWEVVIAPILFTAVALFTRLYKIGISDIVTWDEAQ